MTRSASLAVEDMPEDVKIGDRFSITNPGRPEWATGTWEIIEILPGIIKCKLVEGSE